MLLESYFPRSFLYFRFYTAVKLWVFYDSSSTVILMFQRPVHCIFYQKPNFKHLTVCLFFLVNLCSVHYRLTLSYTTYNALKRQVGAPETLHCGRADSVAPKGAVMEDIHRHRCYSQDILAGCEDEWRVGWRRREEGKDVWRPPGRVVLQQWMKTSHASILTFMETQKWTTVLTWMTSNDQKYSLHKLLRDIYNTI